MDREIHESTTARRQSLNAKHAGTDQDLIKGQENIPEPSTVSVTTTGGIIHKAIAEKEFREVNPCC